MHRELKLNFSNCMKSEIICMSLIVLFTILKQNSLISFCFSMSFIVLLAYSLYRATNTKYNTALLLLIVFSTINVVINALTSTEAMISFDYFKKLLMFIAFMLLLNFSQNDEITVGACNVVLKLPCIIAFILVISFFFANNVERFGGGITLGFSNPNFTGMWLVHFFVYIFLLLVAKHRNMFIQITLVAFLTVIAWLVYETKARSCLIGLIVFLVLCLVGKFSGTDFIKRPMVCGIVFLLPIVIVFIYQYLLNSQWFVRIFSFMASNGKGLDSRLSVWGPSIKLFIKNPILGDYCGISKGTGMSQLHNTHLDVLCSYGIIPFLLFLYSLFEKAITIFQKEMNYFNYVSFIGFLTIVTIGTFEAGVVSGAMGLNIMTAGMILLANNRCVDV